MSERTQLVVSEAQHHEGVEVLQDECERDESATGTGVDLQGSRRALSVEVVLAD